MSAVAAPAILTFGSSSDILLFVTRLFDRPGAPERTREGDEPKVPAKAEGSVEADTTSAAGAQKKEETAQAGNGNMWTASTGDEEAKESSAAPPSGPSGSSAATQGSSPLNAWSGGKGAWDRGRTVADVNRDGERNQARSASGQWRHPGSGGAISGGGANRTRVVVPREDFDFAAMNEKFDKMGVTEDGELPEEIPKFDKKYDAAKSFFDELVSERSGPEAQHRRETERKNYETFGEVRARNKFPSFIGQKDDRWEGGGGGRVTGDWRFLVA